MANCRQHQNDRFRTRAGSYWLNYHSGILNQTRLSHFKSRNGNDNTKSAIDWYTSRKDFQDDLR